MKRIGSRRTKRRRKMVTRMLKLKKMEGRLIKRRMKLEKVNSNKLMQIWLRK